MQDFNQSVIEGFEPKKLWFNIEKDILSNEYIVSPNAVSGYLIKLNEEELREIFPKFSDSQYFIDKGNFTDPFWTQLKEINVNQTTEQTEEAIKNLSDKQKEVLVFFYDIKIEGKTYPFEIEKDNKLTIKENRYSSRSIDR